MIVKIQQSLAGQHSVLVYNQDRSITYIETDPTNDIFRIMHEAGVPKIFARAQIVEGYLEIQELIDPDDWPGW